MKYWHALILFRWDNLTILLYVCNSSDILSIYIYIFTNRARAALIAKKPHRNSEVSQPDPVKQPTRVLHHEGFSTTHYTIPTEYAERADPEEQVTC